ncbi:antitoxin VbhA family protein [Bacillus sp. FSL W8-1127]|uniref:antitoxin VbhA family protein n=1 Tax=Bacillus TaxID=1386 RepID=UPI002E2486F0|nr:antitoxin VbhA family protein [Bacillus smithii]MED4927091.1 antitoxin VbhA family protein [Bacillus smithii]
MKYSKETLQKKFASVKASLEIEGLKVTKEIEDLVIAKAAGEISFEQFKRKAIRLAGKQ